MRGVFVRELWRIICVSVNVPVLARWPICFNKAKVLTVR